MIAPNITENNPLNIIHNSPLISLRSRKAVIISDMPTNIDQKLMLAHKKLAIATVAISGETITAIPASILIIALKISHHHRFPFLIFRTDAIMPKIPSAKANAPKTIARASMAVTGIIKANTENISARKPLMMKAHQFEEILLIPFCSS